MSYEINDARIVFLPLDQVEAGNGICQIFRDYWCAVHPDNGVVFYQSETRRKGQLRGASLQGNRCESTARMIFEKHYPWAEIVKIPLIILPIDLNDYT